jgi:hypothetical protein
MSILSFIIVKMIKIFVILFQLVKLYYFILIILIYEINFI